MTQRLNQIVLFEYGTHIFLTILFLVTMNFLEFILNIPVAAYNVWLFLQGKHMLDEVKILQDDNLAVLRKRELIKLIFFLFCFFLYLYNLIMSAIDASHHTTTHHDTTGTYY